MRNTFSDCMAFIVIGVIYTVVFVYNAFARRIIFFPEIELHDYFEARWRYRFNRWLKGQRDYRFYINDCADNLPKGEGCYAHAINVLLVVLLLALLIFVGFVVYVVFIAH